MITFGNAQILGARESQEDYFAIFRVGPVECAILADGMGGHVAGAVASELAVKSFREFLQENPEAVAAQTARTLLEALEHANQSLAERMLDEPLYAGMGTTLVALALCGGERFHISVGDSPLYLFRGHALDRINENHAFATTLQEAVLAGTMSEEQAAVHPDRSAITSALSGHELSEIDAPDSGVAVRPGDSYLLASDGVHSLADEEILKIMATSPNAQRAAENLAAAVIAKQTPLQDNTTLVVVNILGERITQPIKKVS